VRAGKQAPLHGGWVGGCVPVSGGRHGTRRNAMDATGRAERKRSNAEPFACARRRGCQPTRAGRWWCRRSPPYAPCSSSHTPFSPPSGTGATLSAATPTRGDSLVGPPWLPARLPPPPPSTQRGARRGRAVQVAKQPHGATRRARPREVAPRAPLGPRACTARRAQQGMLGGRPSKAAAQCRRCRRRARRQRQRQDDERRHTRPAAAAPPPTKLHWVGEVHSRRPPRAHDPLRVEAAAVVVTPAATRRHHRTSMAVFLARGGGGATGGGGVIADRMVPASMRTPQPVSTDDADGAGGARVIVVACLFCRHMLLPPALHHAQRTQPPTLLPAAAAAGAMTTLPTTSHSGHAARPCSQRRRDREDVQTTLWHHDGNSRAIRGRRNSARILTGIVSRLRQEILY